MQYNKIIVDRQRKKEQELNEKRMREERELYERKKREEEERKARLEQKDKRYMPSMMIPYSLIGKKRKIWKMKNMKL